MEQIIDFNKTVETTDSPAAETPDTLVASTEVLVKTEEVLEVWRKGGALASDSAFRASNHHNAFRAMPSPPPDPMQ